MATRLEADICVIGGGSGGLSVAAGAAQMGARTVLFEGHKMGGDCLNYGCVPSKALLMAGKTARQIRLAGRFGIRTAEPQVDFQAVHDHVHGVIAAIAPMDSVERFEGLGVTVVQARARFTGPTEITGDDTVVQARRVVIATGSGPFVPPIPGLDSTPYLTNETLFEKTEMPDHLLVIGGGPIGCELAQAHRDLGARVTVLEMGAILPNDDPEASDVVRQRLIADGVELLEGAKVVGVGNGEPGEVFVTAEMDGATRTVTGSHLLVAVGRRPTLDGLGLETAGIAYTPGGVTVDARLRTTNRKVFAIGDAAGGYQFTHVAGYHAGVVIKNALFRIPAKVDNRAVPWVTYTDPELAHVGLDERGAKASAGTINVLRWPFHENDRAQAERDTDGFAKVVTDRKGRILGATIVGPHAGELLQPWILAIQNRMKIGKMATIVAPYPTLGEVSKRAAGSYYTPKLFSERTRKIVRCLLKLG